jgi:hypothetical protein
VPRRSPASRARVPRSGQSRSPDAGRVHRSTPPRGVRGAALCRARERRGAE